MGGIESICGGIHRHQILEIFEHYDEKYIQKWVLHKEAVNLLALKTENINLKEHFTRLYGPRVHAEKAVEGPTEPHVTAARARVQTYAFPDDAEGGMVLNINDSQPTDEELLKQGFASHPYAVYTHTAGQQSLRDSDAHLALQDAMNLRQNRTTMLWNTAFSGIKRESVRKRVSSPVKSEETPQEVDEKGEDVTVILETYNDVKRQSIKRKTVSFSGDSKKE